MARAPLLIIALSACALQGGRGELSSGVGVTEDERVPLPYAAEAEGRVVEVDAAAGTVTLERGDERLVLRASPETSVFDDGRVGALADIVPGDEVRASFDERTTTLHWLELPRRLGPDGELVVPAKDAAAEVKK